MRWCDIHGADQPDSDINEIIEPDGAVWRICDPCLDAIADLIDSLNNSERISSNGQPA